MFAGSGGQRAPRLAAASARALSVARRMPPAVSTAPPVPPPLLRAARPPPASPCPPARRPLPAPPRVEKANPLSILVQQGDRRSLLSRHRRRLGRIVERSLVSVAKSSLPTGLPTPCGGAISMRFQKSEQNRLHYLLTNRYGGGYPHQLCERGRRTKAHVCIGRLSLRFPKGGDQSW